MSLGLNIANFEGHNRALAHTFADKGINAWLYRFDWKIPSGQFGACHCIELPFLFNTFREWNPPMISGVELSEGSNLSQTLQKTWGEFARKGNPNNGNIPYWPMFSIKDRLELHWDKYIEVIHKHP